MSPRSSRDGINFDETYAVVCVHCGLVGQVPKYDVGPTIGRHYAEMHPDEQFIEEGVQFSSHPSPNRCDTCNDVVEMPYWSHISTPPTSVPPIIDKDGRWLVCDTCHNLWAKQDLIGLVRRNWAIIKQQTPGMATKPGLQQTIKANNAERFRLLFERWDKGVRITTENPLPR